MASKEAIIFIVDLHWSMAGHVDLAKQFIHNFTVQKILEGKMNEIGVVLCGVPLEDTNNHLNVDQNDLYQGLVEFCRLEPGNVPMLRKLQRIGIAQGRAPGHGDFLDGMLIALHMFRARTSKKKFARHVYVVTDARAPVSDASLAESVVDMYAEPTIKGKINWVRFELGDTVVKKENDVPELMGLDPALVLEENQKMLDSMVQATGGSVVMASASVKAGVVKETNPAQSKIDLSVGTKLAVRCRSFKKNENNKQDPLKKESLSSKSGDGAGGNDGTVRLDRIFRDPEMPGVEVDFENQVKGYRYGQDYIPVNVAEEALLKLPKEAASLKVLGFVPSSCLQRHLYMDSTNVILPEPGSSRSAIAVSTLVTAMRNLDQVAVVRFVKRAGSDPCLGVLMPDSTGVSRQERFLFQRLPFSEDLRDFSFPSFRKTSKEKVRMSAKLVDAMMIPHDPGSWGIARSGLVLDPVKQGAIGLKVARAMDPDCPVPPIPPSTMGGVSPDKSLLEGAAAVVEEYKKTFRFEKQDRSKASRKRVTYFSDLALAEPEVSSRAPADKATTGKGKPTGEGGVSTGSGGEDPEPRSADAGGDEGVRAEEEGSEARAGSATPQKVGSINPVADFEKIMAAARGAGEGGADLAERAVEQMSVMIHTLVEKGTTSALRAKAVNCAKALRRACVSHFMGRSYNDFLAHVKSKHDAGGRSHLWKTAQGEKGLWPVTEENDASLSMTAKAAAEFMEKREAEQEEEGVQEGGVDDDDLDDLA